MFDYTALATLSEVLRRGSFEGAAAALGVTPPAVSQRIRALEDRLGMVLVDRGPPVVGTPAGLRLMRHADQVAALETDLRGDLDRARPAMLRIAVNADSLATWFLPALTALGPQLRVDLVIDDQDHAANWLRRGEVSAALTAEARPVTGCDSLALGRLRYRATASPDFCCQHFAGGLTAKALAQAPALIFNAKDRLQHRWAEQITGQPVACDGHLLPSSTGFVTAAELGLGWGMNPDMLVAPAIAAGRLVDLAPDHPLDVALFWQSLRVMAPVLAPLTRAVRQAAAATLIG